MNFLSYNIHSVCAYLYRCTYTYVYIIRIYLYFIDHRTYICQTIHSDKTMCVSGKETKKRVIHEFTGGRDYLTHSQGPKCDKFRSRSQVEGRGPPRSCRLRRVRTGLWRRGKVRYNMTDTDIGCRSTENRCRRPNGVRRS